MAASIPTVTRPPFWRDVRVLKVVGQIAFAVLVLAILWYLGGNLTENMRRRNLPTGFGFLEQSGGFQVADTDATSRTPIWRLILIGIKNTALVSVVGIVLATVIGVLVGIARLSTNWLVRKGAAFYVESLRNIPVLVVIIFFNGALIRTLPQIADPIESAGRFIVANQGIWLAWPVSPEGRGPAFFGLLGGALVVALVVAWWRTRLNERTGEPHHRVLWAAGTLVVLGVIVWFALGGPFELSRPARDGFRVTGGFKLPASYLSLLAGLTLYTASHIAEIVRGSILAVPRGQQEAAQALALAPGQRMRHVVLPQALRILVPPTANQYLNLTKNSSLGIAVAYPETTYLIFVIIGNGNPAVQNIAILMAIYLLLSLFISMLTNLYNRRIRYVG